MVHFRPQAREIIVKVVYYGPPLGGQDDQPAHALPGLPGVDARRARRGPGRRRPHDLLRLPADRRRACCAACSCASSSTPCPARCTTTPPARSCCAASTASSSSPTRSAGCMRIEPESWENLKENLLLQGLAARRPAARAAVQQARPRRGRRHRRDGPAPQRVQRAVLRGGRVAGDRRRGDAAGRGEARRPLAPRPLPRRRRGRVARDG